MIYISVGLYAEGRTDYEFLLPLIDRLLDESSAKLFLGAYELANTRGIDASTRHEGRAERIQAAVAENADYCDIFIVHADGGGDPERARQTQINPAMELSRARFSKRTIYWASCIPVREIESWLLVDPRPFDLILGKNLQFTLPMQPEAEIDPKSILHKLFRDGHAQVTLNDAYRFFGMNVDLEKLRLLNSFRRFEDELRLALTEFGMALGHGRFMDT